MTAMVTWRYFFPDYMENETDAREIKVHDRMLDEAVARTAAEKDWREEAWEDGREDASMRVALISPHNERTLWDVDVSYRVSFSAREVK